ncbi:MAG: hypothetical protein IKY62_02990, partial [Clostridia bacterium]|nr:hypothetical protein [Clostridia bacterium]
GTNFCKNLVFDNVFNCSFDAHCGVYNGTIKNSTLEHINFIGGGLIKLENVTVYTDSKHAAINLRTDYGSTWSGDVEIDGLILKHKATDTSNIGIIRGVWNNWYFGYKTYLPQNITLKNVLTAGYTFELVGEGNGNSNRVESNDYIYNDVNVTAFYGALNNPSTDYSAETIEHEPNLNPMAPTKNIYLYTEYTGIYATLGIKTALKFTPPSGAFYKNTKYYIDGILG